MKSLDQFSRNRTRKDGLQQRCKACQKVTRAAWYAANTERHNANVRQWQADNPERVRAAQWKRLYGIDAAEYHRMHAEQGGGCGICDELQEILHVDHDHATGEVRGLLCQPCNLGVGYFRDDPTRLRSAAEYLDKKAS